ncbi:hypothetical protein OMF39_11840, partial [Bordetella pertussis]
QAATLAEDIDLQFLWECAPQEEFDAPFHFLPEYVEELRALYADPLTHPERYFLVAATGDEVLDWREMRDRYPGCRQRIVQGGDHGLSDFPRWMPEVLEFALGSPH